MYALPPNVLTVLFLFSGRLKAGHPRVKVGLAVVAAPVVVRELVASTVFPVAGREVHTLRRPAG